MCTNKCNFGGTEEGRFLKYFSHPVFSQMMSAISSEKPCHKEREEGRKEKRVLERQLTLTFDLHRHTHACRHSNTSVCSLPPHTHNLFLYLMSKRIYKFWLQFSCFTEFDCKTFSDYYCSDLYLPLFSQGRSPRIESRSNSTKVVK